MKKIFGFTLAEVLITLGIIGVVAAITIPGLMTAYKAHQLRTQYLKAYSIVQQLIRRIENDEIALDTNMLSQVKYYLTGATYCGYSKIILNHEPDDSPCFYAKSGLYKTYDGKKTISGGIMDDAQYVLPDGMNIIFEWDTLHYTDGTHCWIYVDINGYKNKPNRWGVDLFTFQVIDGKVLAFGDKGTVYTSASAGSKEEVTVEKYCNLNESHNLNGLACSYLAKSDASYFKRVVRLK